MSDENLPEDHWRRSSRPASHWHHSPKDDGRIICTLCPRHCRMKEGQFGFNGVRGVRGGELRTFNYGKSVAASIETIETEAVYHFAPGARILSLGNIGCMMSCDFCQNWETSQVKHLKPSVVRHYTSEQIVQMCLNSGINVISWTYNDPVVWHEFVVDTSRLAQQHGIRTLFKSAFYIEEAPVRELLECIDIFSISLKSMDADFYRRVTKGRLQPVLDRIKQVHASDRHLEISQLVVTGRNDKPEDFQKTVDWVATELGPDVPVHFVAYHPAYKYTEAPRTPPEVLHKAREVALAGGLRYVYLGNLYEEGAANTHCTSCDHLLVDRFGLTTKIVGVTPDNTCASCGAPSPLTRPFEGTQEVERPDDFAAVSQETYTWNDEVNTLHIECPDTSHAVVLVARCLDGTRESTYLLGRGVSRVAVSRASEAERAVELSWNTDDKLDIYPILDRAHFPVFKDLETNLQGLRERRADPRC